MSEDSSKAKRGPYSSGDTAETPTQFHERLRWLRKQRGLTQVEMAAALGCEQTMISSWESGKTRPTAATLEALARFHGLSSKVIDTGEGFLEHAAVREGVGGGYADSKAPLHLDLDAPLPGRVAVLDQATRMTQQLEAGEAMSRLLGAFKKGRDVWVVMR